MARVRLGELMRRRVPHVLGLYLAAGWGLLEFTDWAVGRFRLDAGWVTGVLVGWALLLPVILTLAWRWGEGASFAAPLPRHDPPPKSVAILPFLNLSEEPGNEHWADGLADEILTALSKVSDLRVASRTSSFAFRGSRVDVRTVGTRLNVRAVLEGSVQRVGDRLRVTTQLVNTRDGFHLWSERYDREVEDVFEIQEEIAQNVAGSLEAILRERERLQLAKVPTRNLRAYEYYLRGRHFLVQTRRNSLEFAREMFSRAIATDPEYALAHAGVAEVVALLAMFYPAAADDVSEGEAASLRALELDPELAEAHAARGAILFVKGDLNDAEEAFVRAIELDPRYAHAHYLFGRVCFQQGRFLDAAGHYERAAALREDYQSAFFAAQSYEAAGLEERARDAYQEALGVVADHMDLNPDDPRAATMRAVSLCRLGRTDEGLDWAEKALRIDPGDAGVRYNVACLYAVAGLVGRSVECLEEAVQAGFGNREWLERDPDLDTLREDPRFVTLLASM